MDEGGIPGSPFINIASGSTSNFGHISAGRNSHIGNINHFHQQHTSSDTRDVCLRALLQFLEDDPKDHRSNLITRKGPRAKGTCSWLLSNENYTKWMEASSGLLWISGDPGKGKTMLALYLIDRYERFVQQDPSARKLVYFFCGSDPCRNTGTSILCGFIYQLLKDTHSATLFKYIERAYTTYGDRLFSNSRFESLWSVFQDMISDPCFSSITFILDGLDECVEEDLDPFLIKIQSLCSHTRSGQQKGLKLLLTSRNHYNSLENELRHFPRIRLEPDNDHAITKDVERFINQQMESLACSTTDNQELHDFVKNKLIEGAGGTYLWVTFAISALKKEKCIDMEEVVQEFPHGLDAMYRRIFVRLQPRKKAIVRDMLRWICMAFRPLTLEELGAAVRVKPARGQSLKAGVMETISFAGDLLGVQNKNSQARETVVVLTHKSIADFLSNVPYDDPELSDFRLETHATHRQLSRSCLDYVRDALAIKSKNIRTLPPSNLNSNDIQTDIEDYITDGYSLFRYALTQGIHHFAVALSEEDLINVFHPLLAKTDKFHLAWLHIQCRSAKLSPPKDVALPHILALLGLKKLLVYCSAVGIEIEPRDSNGRTPLFYATWASKIPVMGWLITRGADVNAADKIGQTSLHVAAGLIQHRSLDTIGLLLRLGADVGKGSSKRNVETLSMFANSLYDEFEYDEGDYEGLSTGTPLHVAVGRGAMDNVELLITEMLRKGVNINAIDDKQQTALHKAASRMGGIFDAVVNIRLLAKYWIGSDITDEKGYTALHIAIKDYKGIQLFEEIEDSEKGCPNFSVVRALVEDCHIPVDITTIASAEVWGGITPLHLACKIGSQALFRYFLEMGADLRRYDASGRTALHWLCSGVQHGLQDRPDILEALLEKMTVADMDAKDSSGQTSLDLATISDRAYVSGLCRAYYPLAKRISSINTFIKAETLSPGVLEAYEENCRLDPSFSHVLEKRKEFHTLRAISE